MKHHSSQALFAYWDTQRGTRAAPERSDIDPAAIRGILADTFVLAADFVEENRFRLAGTKVCALFCRELKDHSFLDLWSAASRKQVAELLSIVNEETLGAVAGVTAVTRDGSEADLELLLLPLSRQGHARVRALGVLAPMNRPYWLGSMPVSELRLGGLRHLGPTDAVPARLTVPVPGGRPKRGFFVYDGGRTAPQHETEGTPAA